VLHVGGEVAVHHDRLRLRVRQHRAHVELAREHRHGRGDRADAQRADEGGGEVARVVHQERHAVARRDAEPAQRGARAGGLLGQLVERPHPLGLAERGRLAPAARHRLIGEQQREVLLSHESHDFTRNACYTQAVRIIAGSAGGRRLKSPFGDAVRPTADRVREALFNILTARGEAPARVLDLYAGSGALGLEALSRGAQLAVFVEEHPPTARLIRENAKSLGFDAACRVVCQRVRDLLRRPPAEVAAEPFGWVFLDPPYSAGAAGELDAALEALGESGLAAGVVVAEHAWQKGPKETHTGLAFVERRRYGQTALSFFQPSEAR
jgi:16S rRNA (guanine966-N2)-methyltransferase